MKSFYSESVVKAGGIPILLPSEGAGHIKTLVTKIDGLLLTGGGDIDPALFGEEPHPHLGNVTPERDRFEISIVQAMLPLNKPILGICRGMQVINVAAGGKVYQDIYRQCQGPFIQHSQQASVHHASHFIQLEKGSLLQKMIGETQVKVNSFHHQAVKDVPFPFKVSGRSSDGVIEAIESSTHPFVVGVQWHPETLKDASSLKLFAEFIKESSEKNEGH